MKGWLIYKKADCERNRFFIDRWFYNAQQRGVQLKLIYFEDLKFGIKNSLPFAEYEGKNINADFAVMRLSNYFLSKHLENMGIRVFNSSEVSFLANKKENTHLALSGLVPMMDTAFVYDMEMPPPFSFPLVIKKSDSCGGRSVFLAKNIEEYRLSINNCLPDCAIVQPLCDSPGKDIRVYVLGNKILSSKMRFSTNGDFRSNLNQGSSFKNHELDSSTLKMVKRILERYTFSLAGIDFIFHKNQLFFNEIEDAVGTRMLYASEKFDVVELYLDYIINSLTLA